MPTVQQQPRERILSAALNIFAERGYEGASVQSIVRQASVTKPTLYYYFVNKEKLYHSLVDWAQDERRRRMRLAVEKCRDLRSQLVELINALFIFAREHRDFTRLCFSTAFAAEGEIPHRREYLEKSQRNFEFIRSLVRRGIQRGELDSKYTSEEIARMIHSQIVMNAMTQILNPGKALSRSHAVRVVDILFDGCRARSSRGGVRK